MPIVLSFNIIVSDSTAVSILLYNSQGEIQHWSKDDVVFDDDYTIIVPLTEEVTMAYPNGRATLSVKMIDSDGHIKFFDEKEITIVYVEDKTRLEGGDVL